MPDIQIKKRIPNLIVGLVFGMLAMKVFPSGWAYVFFAFSALSLAFADEIIRVFSLSVHDTIKIKENIELEIRDSEGNIKGKYKSD